MKRILMAAFLIGFSAQAGTKTLEGKKVLAFAFALNQGVETSRYATHMMELLKYGDCQPSYWTDETRLEFRYARVYCMRGDLTDQTWCHISQKPGENAESITVEGADAEAILNTMRDLGLAVSDGGMHKHGYSVSNVVIRVNPKKLVSCDPMDSGVRAKLVDHFQP